MSSSLSDFDDIGNDFVSDIYVAQLLDGVELGGVVDFVDQEAPFGVFDEVNA